MKKVYKINKAQLQEMIQKETLRQKRILDLKSKRESILKQLNEMYELEGEVEEGWLSDAIKGSHESWKKKVVDWVKQMQSIHGEDSIQMPQGQDLEDAAEAARKYGDFRVVKRNGQWVPTHKSSSGAGSAFS
jgi:hypothetical protein